MKTYDLINFINEYDCEYHWENNDVILFVNVVWVQEFNNLFDYEFFTEGLNCIMKKDYICFEMKEILDYYGIDLKEIFK